MNTSRGSSLIAALVILTSLPPGCESTVRDRPEARVGMTKGDVVATLGEPTRKKTITKQSEQIWGPPEEWWGELKMGESVETWSWEYRGDGTYEVYFLRGDETVSHVSFTEQGVVYEASP